MPRGCKVYSLPGVGGYPSTWQLPTGSRCSASYRSSRWPGPCCRPCWTRFRGIERHPPRIVYCKNDLVIEGDTDEDSAVVKILTHYSAKPLSIILRVSPVPDNLHSPGGFWLSDESEYGWSQHLEYAVRWNPNEWGDAGQTWNCRTDLEVDTSQLLWLKTESDLYRFASKYGEPQERICENDPSRLGYGLHICWDAVKADYKGILISPYQERLSHHHGDPKFHWYRFDCASSCIWDLSCLKPPPHIILVDTAALR